MAEVPQERIETPLARVFGAPPTIGEPMLSPDGTKLLFMQQDPQGVSMLLSLDLADRELTALLQGTVGGYDILWCGFASEMRVLCDLRQTGGLPNRSGAYQQFVAVDIDGTELVRMRQGTGCQPYDYIRNQPRFDRVPDNSGQIIFHCSARGTQLDTYSGRITDVSGASQVGETYRIEQLGQLGPIIVPYETQPGDLARGQWLYSNGRGLISLFRGRQNNLDHWFFRDDVGTAWQEFLTIEPLAFEPPFRPVGYGARLDEVFNIGWNPESGAWALYRQNLTGDFENQIVFAHGAADVERVDAMGRYQRVVAAAFLDDRPRRAIIDRRVAEVYQSLFAMMPDREIEIVDESWDQQLYLARVRTRNRAGEFYLVDMDNESVEPIGPEFDALRDAELAETRLVQFEASSGGSVTGYLTLPRLSDGPVPAVIVPRSRPTHEDIADPHYLVQFLAANGYAVLRVNNRVEEEYGRAWLPERAILGWRQSANDVRDAIGYLIDSGITEPGMVCGVGKDYGAYTAFMTAIEHSELLSCVVSVSGVTDPSELSDHGIELPGDEFLSAARPGEARELLAQASPVRRVDELNVPVLMFHGRGDVDFNVTDHMLILSALLERAGEDVQAIEYPDSDHAILREPDRVDMLTRMRGFLAEHIGPALTEEEAASGVGQWRLVQ